MTDNVMVWRRIERNLFRKLKVYPLRYTPMSVSEQSDLSYEMLLHFGLAEEIKSAPMHPNGGTMASKHFKLKHPEKAFKAIEISTQFFSLAEDTNDTVVPVDCEEMILAIRYRMGYGWWAWLFVRNFAIPIIKWLWKRYHDTDPVGSPAT